MRKPKKALTPAADLIKPDLFQCQAGHMVNNSVAFGPVLIIVPSEVVRCTNKPAFIVRKEGKESIALCKGCYVEFTQTEHFEGSTVKEIAAIDITSEKIK